MTSGWQVVEVAARRREKEVEKEAAAGAAAEEVDERVCGLRARRLVMDEEGVEGEEEGIEAPNWHSVVRLAEAAEAFGSAAAMALEMSRVSWLLEALEHSM